MFLVVGNDGASFELELELELELEHELELEGGMSGMSGYVGASTLYTVYLPLLAAFLFVLPPS